MYAEYENEINEEDLFYQQYERPTDIQLTPAINVLLLTVWIMICLAGFTVIFLGKMPVAGAVIIAVPTFIGMVMKPTFALCLMVMVLTTGAGVSYMEAFALDRGIGIALALSFVLNLLLTRPNLRIRNKALWVFAGYVFWIVLVSLTSPYFLGEIKRAFTYVQLLLLAFIIYLIIKTNGERAFRWVLRSYIVGTIGSTLLTFVTGAASMAVRSDVEGRLGATLGRVIDANLLASFIVMAFLASVYLFARDKNIFWRIMYLGAILISPILLIKTGSRGALVAFAFTLLSPLLFLRQVMRKPAVIALMLTGIIVVAGTTAFLFKGNGTEEGVRTRLTGKWAARKSIQYRMNLVRKAISTSARYPFGTGDLAWFERANVRHWPHNDIFFALGVYGYPGAILFVAILLLAMLTVKRMPLGMEKLYARTVLTYLLVMGLNVVHMGKKYFWVFFVITIVTEQIARLHASDKSPESIMYEQQNTDYQAGQNGSW
jgi:O-antigen ligase